MSSVSARSVAKVAVDDRSAPALDSESLRFAPSSLDRTLDRSARASRAEDSASSSSRIGDGNSGGASAIRPTTHDYGSLRTTTPPVERAAHRLQLWGKILRSFFEHCKPQRKHISKFCHYLVEAKFIEIIVAVRRHFCRSR